MDQRNGRKQGNTTGSGGNAVSAPPVAEAAGVAKRFGATYALRDVSLRVVPGESHALVGRNGAGKSTLVGVLTGLLEPDAGRVSFNGEPAPSLAQREKWRERVACVYQRSTIIPSLSVAENLFLNRQPGSGPNLVSWKALRARAREVLDEWGVEVPADLEASRLTVEQRQLVEIARALSLGSRFIVLDEPTAELEGREIDRLFERVRRLQEGGITFLYISHHLEEIFEICQTVTVLRDGTRVANLPVSETTEQEIVAAMVGEAGRAAREARSGTPVERVQGAQPALRLRGLSLEGWFDDVSLDVFPGECVGLSGLAGSGKAQVADAVAGLLRPDAGEVLVGGEALRGGRVDKAIEGGIGYVPQDRRARGFVPELGVGENITMTILDRLGGMGLVGPKRRQREGERLAGSLQVVASSQDQPVSQLSGGNQQKVVMGRALASDPKVLVLINPTSGVDVASKEALFGVVRDAQERGTAVLLVSDELDELGVCDRVLVMFKGRINGEFGPDRQNSELVEAIEGVVSDGE